MKKQYMEPAIQVVNVQTQLMLEASDSKQSFSISDTEIGNYDELE